MTKKIVSPRPFYEPEKNTGTKEVINAGTKDSGVEIGVTKKGLEISGYYRGFTVDSPLYAVLSKAVKISWDELKKLKNGLGKKRKSKTAVSKPDRVEEELNDEYLKSLPQVHINGQLYYIDSKRRERRSVRNPYSVFKY